MQTMLMGEPGAGKSYSFVAFGLIPFLSKFDNPLECPPEHVFANVRGLDPVAISDYINLLHLKGFSSSYLNIEADEDWLSYDYSPYVIPFTEVQMSSPDFFPIYDPASDSFDYTKCFIKQNSLVGFDEAWSLIGSTAAVGENIKIARATHDFFRFQRHHGCEVWLLTQNFEDPNRGIRKLSKRLLDMRKLSLVGFDNHFTVHSYQGARMGIERREPYSQERYRYDPDIFKLYKSVADGDGLEIKTDNRGSIWNFRFWGLPLYKFWVPLCLVMVLPLLYYSINFFINPPKIGTLVMAKSTDSSLPSTPVSANPISTPITPAVRSLTTDDSTFKLIGLYRFNGLPVALISDSSGSMRYVSNFKLTSIGPASFITLTDGKVAAYWTGPAINGDKTNVPK